MGGVVHSTNERILLKPLSAFLNRVIHADCTTVLPQIPSGSIDLIVTDPPYLVNYRPRDGRKCEGDDSDTWLVPSFSEMYRILKPDSFCVTFYGWPWIDQFMAVWKRCGFRPVSHLVWPKPYPSKEGYTKGCHEVGYLLAKGKPLKPEHPIPDVLRWRYTGNSLHPNEKPVIAILPLLEVYCLPEGVVLDPFAGSGTTAVAARACRRQFILIEKATEYCQTAEKRLGMSR